MYTDTATASDAAPLPATALPALLSFCCFRCVYAVLKYDPGNAAAELVPLGLINLPVCVTSLAVVPGARDRFVLAGDVRSSLFFLRWHIRSFSLLARLDEPQRVLAGEMLVDGGALRFVSCDDDGALSVAAYDPALRQIVTRAQLRLGDPAAALVRRPVRAVAAALAAEAAEAAETIPGG